MRRALPFLALAACSGAPDTLEPLGQSSQAYTQQCATTVVEGVDVYDGQGTITWSQVASSGRGFAFIKASQGDYDTQSTFGADWSGSKAATVLRSPYHFFDGTIDGVTQANHFLSVLTGAGGLEAGDLPAMLDIECPTSSTESSAESGCEYTGDSGWVATPTLIQRAFDWLDTVEQATGKKPIIYSYPSWFGDVGFTDARLAQYPLFIATYATCASVPAPWTSAVFWQYGDDGTVPGINGGVDVDRFFGTKADLGAFAAMADAPDGGGDGGVDAAMMDGEASGGDSSTVGDANIGASDAGENGDGGGGDQAGASSGCSCRVCARAKSTDGGVLAGALAMLIVSFRRVRKHKP